MTPYSPEQEVLLLTARTHLDPASELRVLELCREEVDWKQVIRLAGEHQVGPLVFRSLDRLAPGQVPERVLAHLRHLFHANVAHNLLLVRELHAVIQLLEERQIPVLAYKGPALAVTAYGDLSLRQMGDLDFFVRRQDVPAARTVMEEAGYTAGPVLSTAQHRSFMASECEFWFTGAPKEPVIELHWAVRERLYAYPLSVEMLLARATCLEIAGQPVFSPCVEDLLLILAVHGAKHDWNRLKWICDIAELVRTRADLDWDRVLANARWLHGERLLLLCLRLARDLLGTDLPDALNLDEPPLDRLVTAIRNSIFRDGAGKQSALQSAALYLRMRERCRDRLRFCLELLFTPTQEDWLACPLSDTFFLCYYLIRPLRLAAKYARKAA